ncbi:AMP-binding enzyme [Aspergillus ambiguus]|uniref:putative AMP-binding enzyme n=1 Tax=Aspergillus ambiguus TaxID=176160 RepID=UPI003CCCF7EF
MSSELPLPGVQHGQRILATVIESRAQEPHVTWVSLPVDENDLTRGFRSLSYDILNNAANNAARWLRKHLPQGEEPFQCFAYARKTFMIVPSPLITAETQLRILVKKQCMIYLRPMAMKDKVKELLQKAPNMKVITVPELDEFMQEKCTVPYIYPKTWDEGKEDPWMVFHTSGTTGNPKPITYTQGMMALPDRVASLPDTEKTLCHQFQACTYALPHKLIGMMFALTWPVYLNMVAVIGPPTFPSPEAMVQVLEKGRTDGVLLPPAIVDAMCRTPSGLNSLRQLRYVYYAGAPLSAKSADLLTAYTTVGPAIGSTERVEFHSLAGAIFEHRYNGLHELVFVRQSDYSIQQIFLIYQDRDRYETNDLWVEHPTCKGYWKIVGRLDDYVYLSHGDELHASPLEPEIESHLAVKTALIGGHGHPAPVFIVDLYEGYGMNDRRKMVDSLRPYIEKVNLRCQLREAFPERLIFASKEKPLVQSVKGSVARAPTLERMARKLASCFVSR